MRLLAHALAAACLMLPSIAFAENPVSWIKQTLSQQQTARMACTAEDAAIRGTLSRIQNLTLPETGKVIVVNIASGVVTAYQDGTAVIESKAVVGKKETPTPELVNNVTFIRPNPTWTVPQSIIKKKNWRDKLVEDPQFFEDSDFQVIVGGQTMSPFEAAEQSEAIDTFVQKPGKGNALGTVKIGLDNSDAIYLHDTNDPGKFDAEVRSASAGCVRIEQVQEIAAWALDIPKDELLSMIDAGDTENHLTPEPVKVIIGYWTAWPDADGQVRYYPDIYEKDGDMGQCNPNDTGYPDAEEAAPANVPRFEPFTEQQNQTNQSPAPVWTEYEAR